jgi:hypothetical protein
MHQFRRLAGWSIPLLLFMLVACDTRGGTVASTPTTSSIPHTQSKDMRSSISFTIMSSVNSRSYTFEASAITSKLRHGHREFTIDIENAGQSIFLAFYGYNGPSTYTLAGKANGGDVRIDLGIGKTAWDLPMTDAASCTLTVNREDPTALIGVDRMTGNSACSLLASNNRTIAGQTIAIKNGSFDLLIVIES